MPDPCDCCDGQPSGPLICEDNAGFTVPPPTTGGPWALCYDPSTSSYVYGNQGGLVAALKTFADSVAAAKSIAAVNTAAAALKTALDAL